MKDYRTWETEVNELMIKLHGVGIDDIPDQQYHDWWDANYTVGEAVEVAISIVNEGGF